MTNDELKTAAERRRKWQSPQNNHPHKSPYFNCDGDDPNAIYRDMKMLADAYLSRLAADEQQAKDDAEPIDFGDRVERGCTKDIFISLWKESKVVAIVQHEETVDGPEVSCVTTKIKTRGQLRKLLEALKGGGQ